jgi:hypothetical protein
LIGRIAELAFSRIQSSRGSGEREPHE